MHVFLGGRAQSRRICEPDRCEHIGAVLPRSRRQHLAERRAKTAGRARSSRTRGSEKQRRGLQQGGGQQQNSKIGVASHCPAGRAHRPQNIQSHAALRSHQTRGRGRGAAQEIDRLHAVTRAAETDIARFESQHVVAARFPEGPQTAGPERSAHCHVSPPRRPQNASTNAPVTSSPVARARPHQAGTPLTSLTTHRPAGEHRRSTPA